MRFTLTFNADNADFYDEDLGPNETAIATLLEELAKNLRSYGVPRHRETVRDFNGNSVGYFEFSEDD